MHVEQLASPIFVQSLKRDGYVLVTVPDITRSQIDKTLATAGRFFRNPVANKLPSRLPADLGYRPLGTEFSADPNRPDLMESFTVTNKMGCAPSRIEAELSADLERQMLRTLGLFAQIAEVGLQGLLAWYAPEDSLNPTGAFDDWSLLQLNYARPSELQEDRINDLHEDGCFLTVGAIPSAGLELKRDDESYLSLTTSHDQVVVLAGEILCLLSGGEIQPCFHRVRTVPYLVERMSMLMFADIAPNSCKPWVSSSMNERVDIGKRVLTNSTRFGLQEWPEDAYPIVPSE